MGGATPGSRVYGGAIASGESMRLSSDSFGRRLAAIRKSRGLTQGELGALVGAICACECGLYGVKVGDTIKYCFELPIERFARVGRSAAA
jgi:hypothetical protein